MTNGQSDLLRDAIARNFGAVLSLPSAGMLRHHKSRFLSEHADGFLLAAAAGEDALVGSLIASGQMCGVAFKSGVHKTVFASKILSFLPQWQVSAQTAADALLLSFPTDVKSIQRRANYRVKVPEDYTLRARVWRIAERTYLKEQPMHAQEIATQLLDISTGGMGVRMSGKDGEGPRISPEDRLRVQITAADQSFILEGRMRTPTAAQPDLTITTGITFKKLEDNLEGRQILAQLTRIVGELQRDELRRYRLGMVKVA